MNGSAKKGLGLFGPCLLVSGPPASHTEQASVHLVLPGQGAPSMQVRTHFACSVQLHYSSEQSPKEILSPLARPAGSYYSDCTKQRYVLTVLVLNSRSEST